MSDKSAQPPQQQRTTQRGVLDGLTILRYAHAYGAGGGVEQHLADLHRALGSRNRFTTIQMELTSDPGAVGESLSAVGGAEVHVLRLWVDPQRRHDSDAPASVGRRILQHAVNAFACSDRMNNLLCRCVLARRPIPRRAGEPLDAGSKVEDLLRRFKVDLVVLHASGGADASEIIAAAEQARVPVALIHHFSNDRLCGISMRQQVARVRAVGGASWIGVPRYVRRRFWNLSDTVDTDFFRRSEARPVPQRFTDPVIYAPARVTPDKGQADVIHAAGLLKQRGLATNVVFAGRVDDAAFANQLRGLASAAGLDGHVSFLGQLTMDQYRDWYGPARVMLLPTRHHEGMPRTVIDSQAMGVPPIVYDAGGTREGLRDGNTGFTVRPGDVQAVADRAAELIRNAELHARMAADGRRFVEEQFSMSAFAERHERFYLAALASQNRA